MSRNINVNPGQYKLRGRERQGEDVVHDEERSLLAQVEKQARSISGPRRNAVAKDTAPKRGAEKKKR